MSKLNGLAQESLLALLALDPDAGDKVRARVPVQCFEGVYRQCAKAATDYWRKWDRPPGEHFIDLIEALQKGDKKHAAQIRDLYDSIVEVYPGLNPNFVLDEIEAFLRERNFRSGMIEAVGLMEKGKLADAEATMSKVLQGVPASAAIDFAPMTMAELADADVSVDWLVEGMLVARQPTLLAGPVKSLKTSTLLDLCFSLATGANFLNHFQVLDKIKVVVMTGESGLPVLKDTLLRIAKDRRIDPAKVKGLLISDRIPQLNNPQHLEAIRQLIKTHKPGLLAIDPAYLALDGTDAANVMIFGQQLRGVSQLCQDLGVALLLCHHTKKGSGADHQPLQLTDAAWAGFAEHCRQWLLVNHRERYEHESGSHKLWLSVGGSAGHSGLYAVDVEQGHLSDAEGRCWHPRVSTPTEAIDAAQTAKRNGKAKQSAADCESIVAELSKVGAETQTYLEEKASCGSRRFRVAFKKLVDDGTLKAATVKRANGQNYKGWMVSDD